MSICRSSALGERGDRIAPEKTPPAVVPSAPSPPPPASPQPRPPRLETGNPSRCAGALQQAAAACGPGRRQRSPPLSRQPVLAGPALSRRSCHASSIPSCSAAEGQDGCRETGTWRRRQRRRRGQRWRRTRCRRRGK